MKTYANRRLLQADWWADLGADGQEAYIEQHPKSEKARDAKEHQENPNKQPAKESLAGYAKSLDDPNITQDKIYANFDTNDVAEMKDKVKEAYLLDPTEDEYTDQSGNYTPERLALHQKILTKFLNPDIIKAAKPEDGKKPTFVVLGGRGGSGKSAFTNGTLNEFDAPKFLVMDSDAIKEMLDPPYEGWNANQVHGESCFLFDKICKAAQDLGLNIVSDATLKTNKIASTLKSVQERGYDVEGHYMFLPRQKAALRACGRYLGKGKDDRGRLVPPEVILENTKNEENFDSLKPFFKKWSAYNNDQAKGEPPKLINRSQDKPVQASLRLQSKVYTVANESKLDQWENDPYLVENKERTDKVNTEALQTLKQLGIKADAVSPELRESYSDYLKKGSK